MTIRKYNPKLRLEWLLLIFRVVAIIIWLVLLLIGKGIDICLQISFVAVIFISDAVDGIISRKFASVKSQYFFRIFDTIVDKIGILLFMLVLILLDRTTFYVTVAILGYNILLVVFPVCEIFKDKQKEIKKIQATFFSRLYAVCVGVYAFAALNIRLTRQAQMICLFIFLVLSCVSLFSHIIKIRSLKKGE